MSLDFYYFLHHSIVSVYLCLTNYHLTQKYLINFHSYIRIAILKLIKMFIIRITQTNLH